MLLRVIRIASACVSFAALSIGIATAQTPPSPSQSPAPAATPVPGWNPLNVKGLTLSGVLRAYDFDRLNTPEYNAGPPPKAPAATGPNRYAFQFGGDIRADYHIADSPFTIGGAFWGAYPFGLNGGSVGCNVGGKLVVNENQALCSKNNAGLDNSLPAYPLDTFEYYCQRRVKTDPVSPG